MNRLRRVAFCCTIFAAALTGTGALPGRGGYTFTTIDYPGSSGWGTHMFGINAKSQMVGQYFDGTAYRGFVLYEGVFRTIDIEHVVGAVDINARGDIIGGLDSDVGFLLQDGDFTLLDVPSSRANRPEGINARGDIVGSYDDGSGWHGFVLSNGASTGFDYPGGAATSGRGINARGDIVGTYIRPDGNWGGFLLRDGVFEPIEFPASPGMDPNAYETEALGINDRGDIVGDYSSNHGTTWYAFVLSKGVYTQLDPMAGAASMARSINNKGEIVGGYYLDGVWRGFLAR